MRFTWSSHEPYIDSKTRNIISRVTIDATGVNAVDGESVMAIFGDDAWDSPKACRGMAEEMIRKHYEANGVLPKEVRVMEADLKGR